MTITAQSPNYGPVIIDLTNLAYHERQFPDFADYWVDYYNAKTCANQNDTYQLMGDAIAQMEQNTSAMQDAVTAVADQSCERSLTGDGAIYCIDLFIMTERAGFLIGDNRDFDPGAPYKASRAQIYFNPDLCHVYWVVNTSRAVVDYRNNPPDTIVDEPAKMSHVDHYVDASGDCHVTWALWPGWCNHSPWSNQPWTCPKIDGNITLHRMPDGSFTANLTEDPYPSRGLYKWDGSTFRTISERQQTVWLDLSMATQRTEKMRLERTQVMSGGCEPY